MKKWNKTFQLFIVSLSMVIQGGLTSNLAKAVDSSNMQKFNAIVKEYEEEIQNDPQNIKLITAVADVYYSLREYRKAIIYYRKALELEPDNETIKEHLGFSYLNTNNLIESKILFDELLHVNPSNAGALGGIGRIEALKHHPQDAEKFYKLSLSQDSDNFNTLFYYATFLIEQKDYAEAEQILADLHANNPQAEWIDQALKRAKLGPTLEKIAKLEEANDYPTAIKLMEDQLKKDPENSEIIIALSKLYAKDNNVDQAIRFWKMA